MRAYTSKEELKDEIKKTYTKFIAEFDNIPEEMKDLGRKMLTVLRRKIWLIRLAGQLLLLNGNQTKERVFLSKLLRIILSGISLANYINGSQIHMLSCHCKN